MMFLAQSVLLSVIISLNILGGEIPSNMTRLASHEISLDNRHKDPSVNKVFKDNILLTLAYLDNTVQKDRPIDWSFVEKPSVIVFRLNPGEAFAFHDEVFDTFKDSVVKTTGAHFSSADGFKTDGFLYGDGVCHLASLMHWVAKEAGLEVKAYVDHSFAAINEIPDEFGTSVYFQPGEIKSSARQNLYIKNTLEQPVMFYFEHDGVRLRLSIYMLEDRD